MILVVLVTIVTVIGSVYISELYCGLRKRTKVLDLMSDFLSVFINLLFFMQTILIQQHDLLFYMNVPLGYVKTCFLYILHKIYLQ